MTALSPRRPATGAGRLLAGPPGTSWRLFMADSTQQWVPQSRTVTVACGDYFHAVRVQADIAAPALRLLGSDCGPVLAHDTVRAWWFLLPPGVPAEPGLWAPGIRLLRPGTRIAVPPRRTTAGRDVRWAVAPGNAFTSLEQLRAALAGTPRPNPADPGGAGRPRDRAVPRPQRA